MELARSEIIINIAKFCAAIGATGVSLYFILKQLDPMSNKQKKVAQSKGKEQLERIGKAKLSLSEHELLIASHLVLPDEINVSWSDIAGLDDIVTELSETVIFPIRQRNHLTSKLASAPKGVLLHGPPGCGKTMIAKATAKEAATSFISLDISMLTDKWYGESQKMVAALFSLAEKLEPCIIFIDEIDSLLRNRSFQDHEATAMMKAQFMFLWDGLSTDSEKVVLVMGATNRPADLDAAILRRMPASFRIPLPNHEQRCSILKLILNKETTESTDYNELAKQTEGFSGSDLHELCRIGALYRVRECARRFQASDPLAEEDNDDSFGLRPITMEDLLTALKNMRTSKLQSTQESQL